MEKIYFESKIHGQAGQTVSSNGEKIYYLVNTINGIGEPLAFQVDWESRNGRGSLVFEGKNHIEKNGIHFYLR